MIGHPPVAPVVAGKSRGNTRAGVTVALAAALAGFGCSHSGSGDHEQAPDTASQAHNHIVAPEGSAAGHSRGPADGGVQPPPGTLIPYLYGSQAPANGTGGADRLNVKVGLHLNDPRAFQGYTLLAPMTKQTYLIDMQGRVVHTWETDCPPGQVAYLLDNGHLLRTGALPRAPAGFGAGAGGRVQEFRWDGKLLWDYTLATDKRLLHHDVCRLPNGNSLMLVWEKRTAQEALAAGRKPELVRNGRPLLADYVIEVQPTGKASGRVVWEWHAWDHLIQDHDKARPNYGDVAAHPERIDVNAGEGLMAGLLKQKGGVDKLRSIGYVGAGSGPTVNPDWTHINAVDYNATLDQIMLTVHEFSEVWVIDHSTSPAEAAGHTGGRGGRGGDLLYRWGNPQMCRAGTEKDRQLYAPHNAHWIPKGLPGAGHVLLFNNGMRRPGGEYSSVDEFVLPGDSEGHYAREPGQLVWSYTARKKSDFYSMLISGAQRLPNGDTLICAGVNGTIFEVTPGKETVWEYVNPVRTGAGAVPRPGQILPDLVQDRLRLTAGQKKQVGEFQDSAVATMDKLLTDEQKRRLKDLPGFGQGGAGTPSPRAGEILSPFAQARLKLSAAQKRRVADLQRTADALLAEVLTAGQKKQLHTMPDAGRVPAPGALFRAYRYGPGYPGLAGKQLTPGKAIEESQPHQPTK